jgi:hypothetical protein
MQQTQKKHPSIITEYIHRERALGENMEEKDASMKTENKKHRNFTVHKKQQKI